MKNLALKFCAVLCVLSFAYAAEQNVFKNNAFSQQDIDMLFHSKPLALASLSEQEMRETEGEWIPLIGAVAGGFLGGAYNIGNQIGSRSWSWSSFARDVVVAGIAGARLKNPISAIRAIQFIKVAPGALAEQLRVDI